MSSEDQYIQKRIKKYWLEQLKQYKFTKYWPTEFGDIIKSLRKERCLEYLSDKEMESRFSSFASDLIMEINQGKEIDKRIDDFISSIVKPLDELEFLFPIRNLTFNSNELKIGDIIIKNIEDDSDILIKKSQIEETFDPFEGNYSATIAETIESGTNLKLMEKRAARKVDLALNILRLSLSEGIFFSDGIALFSRTELTLFRKKGLSDAYRYSWHRSFKPIQVKFDLGGTDKFNTSLKNLSDAFYGNSIAEELLERLRKATVWISRSIREEDFDLKIIYLCTALESLLISRDIGRKSEDLAYKILLLNLWSDKPFLLPRYVLELYNLRSAIIHQGKIEFSTKDDYRILRRIAIDILFKTIDFINVTGVTNYKEFMKELESEEKIEEVRFWLEAYNDSAATKILEWTNAKK